MKRLKLLQLLFISLFLMPAGMAVGHEGHGHAQTLAISLAFDPSGTLWRVSVTGGFVVVDSSSDMGKSFSSPRKLNTKPQKVGTSGDARPKLA